MRAPSGLIALVLLVAGCGSPGAHSAREVERVFLAAGVPFQSEQLPNPDLRPANSMIGLPGPPGAQRPDMVDGGLGVRAYDHPRGTAYGHGGAMAGYTVQLRATRDGEHIVIAAANSHSIPVLRAVATTVDELF